MLVAAAGLLGGYMFLVSGVATLRAKIIASDPTLAPAISAVWRPLTRALAGGLVFVAFFLIYRFVAAAGVPMRVTLLGAALASGLWFGVSALFSHFIGRSTAYFTLYGSMTSVVLFGLWAYMSGIILLASAAFAAAYFDVFGNVEAAELPEDADDARG